MKLQQRRLHAVIDNLEFVSRVLVARALSTTSFVTLTFFLSSILSKLARFGDLFAGACVDIL